MRDRPGRGRLRDRLRPELKLASAFLAILLASLSRSMLFLEAAAAFELGCLCLLRGEAIARTIEKVAAAGFFALVILSPAFLLGRGAGVPVLCAKVLLAMLAAALFSTTTACLDRLPPPCLSSHVSSFSRPCTKSRLPF